MSDANLEAGFAHRARALRFLQQALRAAQLAAHHYGATDEVRDGPRWRAFSAWCHQISGVSLAVPAPPPARHYRCHGCGRTSLRSEARPTCPDCVVQSTGKPVVLYRTNISTLEGSFTDDPQPTEEPQDGAPAQEHSLKLWPREHDAVRDGSKTFEVRNSTDRSFGVGDVLLLRRWDPAVGLYLGDDGYAGTLPECADTIRAVVTYVLHGGRAGLPPGICVLVLRRQGSRGAS